MTSFLIRSLFLNKIISLFNWSCSCCDFTGSDFFYCRLLERKMAKKNRPSVVFRVFFLLFRPVVEERRTYKAWTRIFFCILQRCAVFFSGSIENGADQSSRQRDEPNKILWGGKECKPLKRGRIGHYHVFNYFSPIISKHLNLWSSFRNETLSHIQESIIN